MPDEPDAQTPEPVPSQEPPVNDIPNPANKPMITNPTEDSVIKSVAELEREPDPVTTIEPIPTTPTAENSFQPPIKPKSKKKTILILLAIVLFVLVAGGTAFAMWYTYPDNVTADAVKNLVSSKTMINEGNYSYTDKTDKFDISFKTQSDAPNLAGSLDAKAKIKYQDFSVNVDGAVMMSQSGIVYFKLNNAGELVNKALETDYGKLYIKSPKLQDAIKKFVAKIDNKWIKLDQNDIDSYSKDYKKERTCSQKTLSSFYNDSSQQNEVVDAYKAHRFIVVKNTGKTQTINGHESVGYALRYDGKKGNEFETALNKTKVSKELKKCSGDKTPDHKQTKKEQQTAEKEANKAKTIVWISRWDHQLTKVEVTSDDKGAKSDFSATFKPNEKTQLTDPKSSIKAKDLQKDFENLYTTFLSESGAGL